MVNKDVVPTLKAHSLPGGGSNMYRAQSLKEPECLGIVNSFLLELSGSDTKEMSCQQPEEFSLFLRGI